MSSLKIVHHKDILEKKETEIRNFDSVVRISIFLVSGS